MNFWWQCWFYRPLAMTIFYATFSVASDPHNGRTAGITESVAQNIVIATSARDKSLTISLKTLWQSSRLLVDRHKGSQWHSDVGLRLQLPVRLHISGLSTTCIYALRMIHKRGSALAQLMQHISDRRAEFCATQSLQFRNIFCHSECVLRI